METVEEIKRLLEDMQKVTGFLAVDRKTCECCEEKGLQAINVEEVSRT